MNISYEKQENVFFPDLDSLGNTDSLYKHNTRPGFLFLKISVTPSEARIIERHGNPNGSARHPMS